MKFTFVTLFENLVSFYFDDSILKKAIQNKLLHVAYVNPRDFSVDKHKKVDDYQVGGGAGLLLQTQPLYDALNHIKIKNPDAYFVFAAPAGKPFVQFDAKRLARKKHIVFVSGRYEGIDERVVESFCDEVFSIGDYILTGGELASLVMCDAISRNITGVLGNENSLDEESFEHQLLEAPSFAKPIVYANKSVPSEFLKGNHAKMSNLKNELAKLKTQYFRPDLFFLAKTRR
ncbi:MAG: tRNA (guanosine(37)-N1)-methyltransferase TrmD [Sulfurospirillum sp.]|nr:tRNA (guanosine(37)-N1)-methyltransferase TrmD [Sulfurospirillum sp.]